MKILLATSEAVPLAKTGGLADVCGALPRALEKQGHDTAIILPAYRQTRSSGMPIESTGIEVVVPIGNKHVTGQLLTTKLPDSEVRVFLVQQDDYFDRKGLYGEEGVDYTDNCERFVFFSRAVLKAIRLLDLQIDLIHANDWQTGLIPAYLQIEYRDLPGYERIASLFAIHNMGYPGEFWHWDMLLTGLDWRYFNWRQMDHHGKLNLLKTGLVFADRLVTVSPRYAQEIQTPQLGFGLEGVLQYRGDSLTGILNGIDTDIWNPDTDPHIESNYSVETVDEGKPECKIALQKQVGFPLWDDVPLIGIIGRMAEQKGFDLVADVLTDRLEEDNAQWVILGTGEARFQRLFRMLAERYPNKFAVILEFSEAWAHRIEAGSDLFLMPSRYEPCGLNQMFSLRYGTIPLVRETGGLADTIVDTTPKTLANGTANGFCFQEDNAEALRETLARALNAFRQPKTWAQLIDTGMRQDWSWDRSAEQYVALYEKTLER